MNNVKLNKNATSFNFKISKISKALDEFFTILFTLWETDNVESIISRITVETMDEINVIFKELFINIYQLASNSKLNCNNVVHTIDALDMFLPEMLITKLNKPTNVFLSDYEEMKKRAFKECFIRIKASFELYREIENKLLASNRMPKELETSSLMLAIESEIRNVLNVLTKISKIKEFQSFVYSFSMFLWEMFYMYHDLDKIRRILLITFSNITDQLVKFLQWKIDGENCMEASTFVSNIFYTFKTDLINSKFFKNEIPCVLDILDKRNRFIGKFLDAIPENMLDDNGLIICSSVTRTLETDDVYEDYEAFLLDQ